MSLHFVIGMVIWGAFGGYSAYLGHTYKTKEFWILAAFMTASSFIG